MERRLVAVLLADVVAYSRLMGVDEAGTIDALKTHRKALMDPAIELHNGRIVKTTGDGILIEFPSVVEAVQCAVDVQRGMGRPSAVNRANFLAEIRQQFESARRCNQGICRYLSLRVGHHTITLGQTIFSNTVMIKREIGSDIV